MNASMKDLTMELLLRYGFQMLAALAILAIGFLIARWLGRVADRRFQKQQMEPPMRILLVEDEDPVRMVVCRSLERQGYRVIEARSGTEAAQILRDLTQPIDLLLSDVVLPGLTGLAQINGRNVLRWEEKLDLDVWYVDHQSFLLDVEILVRSVTAVVARRGASPEGSTEFRG